MSEIFVPVKPRVLTLQELERRHIIRTLEACGCVKSDAALALGITTKTLYNKLHEYGVFEQYKSACGRGRKSHG